MTVPRECRSQHRKDTEHRRIIQQKAQLEKALKNMPKRQHLNVEVCYRRKLRNINRQLHLQ